MYLKPNDLDPTYRDRLWKHFTVLMQLECGADVPLDQVMLALAFVNSHIAMLMNMAVDES